MKTLESEIKELKNNINELQRINEVYKYLIMSMWQIDVDKLLKELFPHELIKEDNG